jgi:predicted DNA-binding transcriptional regulator AlpA
MEHEIKRERVTDSIAKRREAGKDLGMSRATFYRRSNALEP